MFKNSGQDSGYEDEQNDLHILCQTGSIGEILTYLQSSPRGTKLHWYYDGQTALHTAVLSGRSDTCDVVGLLLDHGADINAQTVVDSNTALHLVVLHGVFPGDVDTVVFFLQKKADLTIRNKKLRTPYDCAIASGNYELAGILNGSVPPDKAKELYVQRCKQKYGPKIIKAVLENNETELRNSIQLGGDPNTLNKHGAGAIHYTVTHCKLPVYDTLLVLLESGADANLRDEGDAALNLVIKNNKLHESGIMVKCVQLLIDWGAQPDIKDLDGKDAHQLALEKKYTNVQAVLKKKPKKISKIKTERKKNVIFKEISSEISDVSNIEKNEKPPTPTPEVSVEKTPSPIPLLQQEPLPQADSEVNIPPLKSLTEVIMIEDETIRHNEIKNLLEKGTDVNQRVQSTGNTALHICAEKNYGNTAKLLMDHNIDYKAVNKNGKTAYGLATVKKSVSVMKAISEKQHNTKTSAESSSCLLL